MSRPRANLADLQAAYADGRAQQVQAALLQRPVRRRRKPKPVPAQQPDPARKPRVRPSDGVYCKPADWPWRILPADVDAMTYRQACEVLDYSDEPLIRLALGWSAPDAPHGAPRLAHVIARVTTIRREILRQVGYATGRVNPPRDQTKRMPVRTQPDFSPVVVRYRDGVERFDATGALISHEEAATLLAQVRP